MHLVIRDGSELKWLNPLLIRGEKEKKKKEKRNFSKVGIDYLSFL